MAKFKIGSLVKVEGYSRLGRVLSIDKNGNPTEVIIGDEVVNVINKAVELIGLIRILIELIKKIFK